MKNAKILIVEDEGLLAESIQVTLERLGYRVPATASDGEEAIEKTRAIHPDLVLMDVTLKGKMDGIEAALHISKKLKTPVVYLSGQSGPATLQRASLTHPYGYMVKPLVERDLHATIEMALSKHRADMQVLERGEWFARMLAGLGEAVIVTDPEGAVRFLNPLAEQTTGWTMVEAVGCPVEEVFALAPGTAPLPGGLVVQVIHRGQLSDFSGTARLRPRTGPEKPVDFTAVRIRDDEARNAGIVIAFHDITQRKQAEADREQLIADLRGKLAGLKTLQGVIPICACCKKIRDAQGEWQPVDAYVSSHALAKFSHAICPDCMDIYYSGVRT